MFAGLERRARGLAERRVEARLSAIEGGGELPRGVELTRAPGKLVLSGRGLRRRFITEPGLRWLGRPG